MNEENRSFDPMRHLTKVSGKDYLEVKYRLVWFHDRHPDGSIVTEMIQHQNNHAVFRAAVSWATDSGIATRTGYGSEGSDDFGDYLEKAETKAIGRALAAAGFGTQFCDDHAFGADRQRVVDSPVDIRRHDAPQARQRPDNRRYAQLADTSPEAPQNRLQDATADAQSSARAVVGESIATPKQQGLIRALVVGLDWTREDVESYLDTTYGVKRIGELGSRQDVSKFIDHLQALKAANEPAPVGAPA